MVTSINHGNRRPDGDDATFDDVLGHYQAEVYCFALHLTRDHAQANDLYQKTLQRAFHAFDERVRSANERSWLFTIATDLYMSDGRRRGSTGGPVTQQAPEIRGTAPVQTDRLDAHALQGEVEAFVTTLPRHQWVALVQRRYLNVGYAEIAETLSCSEVEARSCVYEALRAMRAHVGDRL